ncbi:MarR family transcriptional regulator [Psychrobacter sp. TB55-MNA-CIBAN-0194]|uniref:MarR family winged helix-turn-helix transcriptional regulator n=1 Tax=Psychrobacter sp. TB55-MNA-CIBAN-0194 TaxID=3140445 RepID=UPI00332FCBBE
MQTEECIQEDAVQKIISQWQNQGFASDSLLAMETIGRIKRLEVILMRKLSANYKINYQISRWEFDVLATLRRAGTPYLMSPTVLFDSMMVSSGTMTNRLQHLEKKGFIERIDNIEDKRSLLVQLTPKGLKLIDIAVVSHVQLENDLMKDISKEELLIINLLLRKVESQLPVD